ncbi:RidA family protein [Kiloniella laminariae]|uniref:RidA family protein n=1 Tax=Kiloniella laminariae TaxID=454162 RepID=UPI000380A8E9|nr:RidA family protein [Kiloniella laminariae]
MTGTVHRQLQPPGWPVAKGYSNGIIAARGQTVYLAGIIGWNEKEEFESDDFAVQFRQALQNIVAVLKEAEAKPEHIVRMTWFIRDKQEYLSSLKAVGEAYREVIGRHYPVMAVVEVSAFMEDRAKLEIETTAVIPD